MYPLFPLRVCLRTPSASWLRANKTFKVSFRFFRNLPASPAILFSDKNMNFFFLSKVADNRNRFGVFVKTVNYDLGALNYYRIAYVKTRLFYLVFNRFLITGYLNRLVC